MSPALGFNTMKTSFSKENTLFKLKSSQFASIFVQNLEVVGQVSPLLGLST
jgi:hypothetical protein